MHEGACLLSPSGTPNTRSSALFLLHHRDEADRDRPPVPPVFLFAEECPATPFVLRYCQGVVRAQFATRHRLWGTGSRNCKSAPVQDKHALLCGRASLPRGMTTRHRTSQRDETGHRPLPPVVLPNWTARTMRRSRRPTLHQSSAAVTSLEPAQLGQALTSSRC